MSGLLKAPGLVPVSGEREGASQSCCHPIFWMRLSEGSALRRATQQEMRWGGVLSPGGSGWPVLHRSARPEWPQASSKQRQLRGTPSAGACLPGVRSPDQGQPEDPGAVVTESSSQGVFHQKLQFQRPSPQQGRIPVAPLEEFALERMKIAPEVLTMALGL